MAAMIQNDEEKEWMLPLLEVRNALDVRDSDGKRSDYHLRDFTRDEQLFAECSSTLPRDLIDALKAAAPRPDPRASDDGAHYKRAEIGITNKVDDPDFFSPGYSSPFNPHDTGTSRTLLLPGVVALSYARK